MDDWLQHAAGERFGAADVARLHALHGMYEGSPLPCRAYRCCAC